MQDAAELWGSQNNGTGEPRVMAAVVDGGDGARADGGEGRARDRWEGKETTFMRSNEHSRDRKQRWNTSGLEGTALAIVEGDREAPKCGPFLSLAEAVECMHFKIRPVMCHVITKPYVTKP